MLDSEVWQRALQPNKHPASGTEAPLLHPQLPSDARQRSPPHTRGAVEVEEGAGGRVRVLLTLHVVIQRHLLRVRGQLEGRTC